MLASSSRGKKVVAIARDTNEHVRGGVEDYENQHVGYGFGVFSKEEERGLKFCAALNMTVGHTLLKKNESHPVIY